MKIIVLGLILSGLALAGDLVQTPAGPIPRASVARIAPGQGVRQIGGQLQIIDLSTKKVVRTLPTSGGVRPNPNWISYALWNNTSSTPLSSFSTTWVVPAAPASQSSQLIYLFNGIEPASRTAILQPVLQWGVSPAGGGPYWAVASWYVSANGGAVHTDPVRVSPGDKLVGLMTLTSNGDAGFSYRSEFDGIANTALPVENIDELVLATETLEAYSVGSCDEYPTDVAFTGINLLTGTATPGLTWTPYNNVTDCGQHVTVVNNSATGGEVDVHTN